MNFTTKLSYDGKQAFLYDNGKKMKTSYAEISYHGDDYVLAKKKATAFYSVLDLNGNERETDKKILHRFENGHLLTYKAYSKKYRSSDNFEYAVNYNIYSVLDYQSKKESVIGIVQSDSHNEKDCRIQTLSCFLGQPLFRIGNFIFSDVFENRYVATFDMGLINPLSKNNTDSDVMTTKKEWSIADIFAQTAHTTETDLFNTTYNSLTFAEAEVKIAGLLNMDIPCKTESIDRLTEKKNFDSSYRAFRQNRKNKFHLMVKNLLSFYLG